MKKALLLDETQQAEIIFETFVAQNALMKDIFKEERFTLTADELKERLSKPSPSIKIIQVGLIQKLDY